MNDLLYVCSPYRGDTKRNKEYARKLTRAALDNGFIPVTVNLYLTEATDDKYILVGDRYGISEGMKAELTFAAVKGKIMLYEKDGKIYLVNSRQETTGGMDHE